MVINCSLLDRIRPEVPRRFIDQSAWPPVCHVLILSVCILFLHGCAVTGSAIGGREADSLNENYFLLESQDDVLGRLAVTTVERGDTLPDIARHFSLGINTISAANPELDVWVPGAGESIVLPLSFIVPEARRKGIVINLAAMRLFYFKRDGNRHAVSTFPIGVGTDERPTPEGGMHITGKKFRPTWHVPASIAADHARKGDPLPAQVPPGPQNPLGEYALYLSRSGYLVHGTNKPASIGLRATNGCIRLYPEDIEQLFDETPVNTPVTIVNQPYLAGRREGMVYLEAHAPPEGSGMAELNKTYAKLKKMEQKTGHALDWNRIRKVIAEARGIPVAVSAVDPRRRTAGRETLRVRHPVRLSGRPQVPELRTDAWYVLAAIMPDKADACRLAAIINHQGPHIPARVLSNSSRHRVLAGPFINEGQARDAVKRMKIDLQIDGIVVSPVQRVKARG